jgi:hypothetical protein
MTERSKAVLRDSRRQLIKQNCRLVRPTRLVRFNVLVAEERGGLEFPHSESAGGNYKAFVELLRLGRRESQSQRVPQKIVQAIRAQAWRWLFES